MNAAIGGASSCANDRGCLGSEAVNPFASSDGLARIGIGAESGPIALFLDLFIGNGAFHNENEGIKLSFFGQVPMLHKVVADFVGKHWVMQMNLGKTGN